MRLMQSFDLSCEGSGAAPAVVPKENDTKIYN